MRWVEMWWRRDAVKATCSLAGTVGAEFFIKEVKTYGHSRLDKIDPFKMISAFVDCPGEEPGLDRLEMLSLNLNSDCHESFFSVLKACKSWKIQTLSTAGFGISDYNRWAGLAKVAATGHIGTLEFEIVSFFVKRQPPSKEDVKAVWEIAEKFKAVIFNDDLELVSRV